MTTPFIKKQMEGSNTSILQFIKDAGEKGTSLADIQSFGNENKLWEYTSIWTVLEGRLQDEIEKLPSGNYAAV